MADGTSLDAMEETVKKLKQTANEHSQWLDDHQQTLGTLNSMLTTLDAKFDQYIALLTEKFGALPPPAVEQTEVLSDDVDDEDANCDNTQLVSLEELMEDGLLTKEELSKPIDAECVDFSMAASPLFSHA